MAKSNKFLLSELNTVGLISFGQSRAIGLFYCNWRRSQARVIYGPKKRGNVRLIWVIFNSGIQKNLDFFQAMRH